MTPTQLEAAARHYCSLIGADPDEPLKLKQPIPGAHGPIDSVPRWKPVANAVLDQFRLLEAINVALDPNIESQVNEKT